jgi:6-phosphogluconate dehydrogenase
MLVAILSLNIQTHLYSTTNTAVYMQKYSKCTILMNLRFENKIMLVEYNMYCFLKGVNKPKSAFLMIQFHRP